MFIESNLRMQDIFRDGLKRCGYRVLLTSDPQRALARFEDDAKSADCVVFSTGDLGESALEAFNAFGEGEATRNIPAVLLLGDTVMIPESLRSVPIVRKPYADTTLAAAITALLHGKSDKSGDGK